MISVLTIMRLTDCSYRPAVTMVWFNKLFLLVRVSCWPWLKKPWIPRNKNKVYLAANLKSMKKFLLSMIAICAISFTQNVFGQCTPDPSIKSSGTFPAALEEAKVGESYEQVIQYFITKDTTVFVPQLGQTVNATIDTLRILNVLGMPDGFTYTCHNADCKIVGGTGGCAKLIGTPKSGSAGIYPLIVLIGIRATAYLGPLPVGQNVTDSNARYSITVNPASGNMEINEGNEIVIYPNPAKESVQFYLPAFKGEPSTESVKFLEPE